MNNKSWLTYTPGEHEKKITEFFGSENVTFDKTKFRSFAKKILFVCFTNRCGSNIICEHLGTGKSFNVGAENLNFDAVIDNSTRLNFSSFSEYLNWLMNIHNSNKEHFVIKCSWDQLYFLEKYGYINNDFNEIRSLHVKRLSSISQAISYSIALQTGSWNSLQKSVKTDIEYQEDVILRFLKDIGDSHSKFDNYLSVKNIKK